MRCFRLFFLLAMPLLLSVAGAGETVAVDRNSAKWFLPKEAQWLSDGTLKVSAGKSGRYIAFCGPDVSRFAGKFVRVSALVKAENVAPGARPNHGVKLMVSRNSNGLGSLWKASSNRLWGSFDWKREEVCLLVPEDITAFRVHVGVEHTTGTALFREIKIEELDGDLYPPPVPLKPDFRCEYTDSVRNLPRLRGVCVRGEKMTPEAIRKLGRWRCNAVRWWIENRSLCANMKQYWPWLESQLRHLEKLAPELRKAGIGVILTVTVPGGRYVDPIDPDQAEEIDLNPGLLNEYRTCFSDRFNREYQKLYRMLGKRFAANPVVIGYDLMNEPTHGGGVKYDYLKSQYLAARALRETDPEKPVFVSCCEMGPPSAFTYLKPIPLRNVIYQVHMYVPGSYTHQRFRTDGKMISYPGTIDRKAYDKKELLRALEPTILFQRKYGAVIYAGEYSVLRWAPGGARYLKDLTELFDQLGWHSTYHAFREWEGWSLEHSSDGAEKKPVAEETDRARVIRDYFRGNKRFEGLKTQQGKGRR